MKIINKSSKEQVFKLKGKWIHFMAGQVKEGFPDSLFDDDKSLKKHFKKIQEEKTL